MKLWVKLFIFFFQAEDGIRDADVTGVQTCALPIYSYFRCGFNVTGIVQRIENTNDVHTVGNSLLYKVLHHIVGVVTVTQKILSPQQHLQRRFLSLVLNLAQTLPGVLIQKSNTSIKSSTTPGLQGVVTHLIKLFYNW